MKILKRVQSVLHSVRYHFADPAIRTYYPDSPRKSRAKIYFEQAAWLLRYGHFNKHYYYYGLDRKDAPSPGCYLPEKFFDKLQYKLNAAGVIGHYKINYTCMLRDKFLFGQYLHSLGIAAPRIYAICDHDRINWLDSKQTEPLESIVKHEGLDCFVKALLSEIGREIYPLKVRDSKILLGRREVTVEDFKAAIRSRSILQERLFQHPSLAAIYPYSINTLRLVTMKRGDTIELLGSVLRVGAGGNYCDNWGIGGIAIGIEPVTGTLGESGTYDLPFGRRADKHPQTGFVFGGFEVPYFKEAVELAIAAHGYFYGVHSIGWDIAVTPGGPVCIEGNENWGMPIMAVWDNELIRKYFAATGRTIREVARG